MKRLFLDVTSSNYDGANGAISVIPKRCKKLSKQELTIYFHADRTQGRKNIKSL